ncbi:hypothetical protein SELMODRAFT_415974 [Selaginella moellendorffii]|uniref:USP domain-containing protein n=1 Tax=Selaginella moellendorffii TaxID=88036 RepID=D8RXP2_SELML|nr:hypothetical protein SELMODRAFT_415974 [Selaginella moellendorffii]
MAIGLQNQGSTCSMNSSLQCLLHTPRLSDFFAKSDKIRGEVANDFRKLIIESMRSNASVSIKPGPKLQSSPGSQQDAQEYLMFLLNALDQELKQGHDMRAATKMKPVKSGRKDRKGGGQVQSSLVAEIFEGQSRTKLQCPKCSNEASVTLETFMSLSLPVPSSTVGNTITLESCIQEYTKDDMLDAWCCSKCKSKQHNICKKMEFVKLPACLILHLARFKCDSSGNVEKIDTAIDIPESVEISGQHYSLYGLINHTGDADYGHYTASIKLGNSECCLLNRSPYVGIRKRDRRKQPGEVPARFELLVRYLDLSSNNLNTIESLLLQNNRLDADLCLPPSKAFNWFLVENRTNCLFSLIQNERCKALSCTLVHAAMDRFSSSKEETTTYGIPNAFARQWQPFTLKQGAASATSEEKLLYVKVSSKALWAQPQEFKWDPQVQECHTLYDDFVMLSIDAQRPCSMPNAGLDGDRTKNSALGVERSVPTSLTPNDIKDRNYPK